MCVCVCVCVCNLALPSIRGVDKTCTDAGEMLEVYVWVTNCFGRLVSLAGSSISIIFVATNKHAFLSRQKYARQNYICRDKHEIENTFGFGCSHLFGSLARLPQRGGVYGWTWCVVEWSIPNQCHYLKSPLQYDEYLEMIFDSFASNTTTTGIMVSRTKNADPFGR